MEESVEENKLSLNWFPQDFSQILLWVDTYVLLNLLRAIQDA